MLKSYALFLKLMKKNFFSEDNTDLARWLAPKIDNTMPIFSPQNEAPILDRGTYLAILCPG